jgi:hypothetical protein
VPAPVLVDRQLVTIIGRPPFLAPPKTAASMRSIPLPTVVVDTLAAHLAAYPPLEDGFVFVTDAGRPIRRTAFQGCMASGGQGRWRTNRDGFPRATALLCWFVDQAWGERQGCAGAAWSRERVRGVRHVVAPVAG